MRRLMNDTNHLYTSLLIDNNQIYPLKSLRIIDVR